MFSEHGATVAERSVGRSTRFSRGLAALGRPGSQLDRVTRWKPSHLDRACPSRRSTETGFGSIGQHVFVVRGRIDILARFVGVGSRTVRWGRSGWPAYPGAWAGRRGGAARPL